MAVGKPASQHPMPKAVPKSLHQRPKLSAVGTAAIMAAALYLSANSNYLFFKELLVAFAIVSMTLLLSYLGKPLSPETQPNSIDPRLN